MSPTIPINPNTDKRPGVTRPSTGERRSELVCRVKYCNTLPDIPFDPKFITYPFESTRFIQYNPTSLERNYKYEVLTEHDLGVTIDLINKDAYAADYKAQLDPADEKLLEEDILTPHDCKRSRHHSRSVSWLRKTEYISTEQTRFQPQNIDKVEAKVGYSIKKSLKEETLYMDRESQIKAIEKTFEDSKKPIEKHYSKPNVVPLEILPIFPDFKMWKYPCAQVMFDSDPAPVGMPVPAQIEEMSQAMIRGVMDESGEQFVAYFLPTAATLEKRRRDFAAGVDYEDEEEYEYKIAREYNWNVKTKASKGYEENYFLVVRHDGAYYNELETRVRLSKRRQKVGQPPNNTRLVVKHRPMDAQEFNIHRTRERQLEPPQEEEEEEEDDDEEETQRTGDGDKKNGKSGSESDKEDKESDSDKEEKEDSGSENEKDKSESENDKDDKSGSEIEKEDKSGSDKSDSERDQDKSESERDDEKSGSEREDAKSGSERGDGSGSEKEGEGSEDEKSPGSHQGGASGSEDEGKASKGSSRSASPSSSHSGSSGSGSQSD